MGEPGMGKSRLCYEGITRHLSSPWACLETRAVAYGQAIPYLPMIDLLKAYFRLDERDRAPTIRDKVTATLLALDAALQPTLPAFLTLLDVPVEAPTGRPSVHPNVASASWTPSSAWYCGRARRSPCC